jgi:hypothetical protein
VPATRASQGSLPDGCSAANAGVREDDVERAKRLYGCRDGALHRLDLRHIRLNGEHAAAEFRRRFVQGFPTPVDRAEPGAARDPSQDVRRREPQQRCDDGPLEQQAGARVIPGACRQPSDVAAPKPDGGTQGTVAQRHRLSWDQWFCICRHTPLSLR